MITPITINMKSRWFTRPWHVQLATEYGSSHGGWMRNQLSRDGIDTCSYLKKMSTGALLVCFITMMLSALLSIPFGIVGGWVVASVVHGMIMPTDNTQGAMFLIGTYVALAAVAYGLTVYKAKMTERPKPVQVLEALEKSEPSVIRELYNSWRTKVCVQLRFVGGDGSRA